MLDLIKFTLVPPLCLPLRHHLQLLQKQYIVTSVPEVDNFQDTHIQIRGCLLSLVFRIQIHQMRLPRKMSVRILLSNHLPANRTIQNEFVSMTIPKYLLMRVFMSKTIYPAILSPVDNQQCLL